MRALAITLFLCTACGSKALKECEAGKALSPSEHLHRCAGLIKEPKCRQYVLDLDGGAFHSSVFGERCRSEYCGRFSRPVPLCVGKYGTPAGGYAPELDFLTAVFEVDYGATSELARSAFFEAAGRELSARVAADEELRSLNHREARLILRLEGDRENLTLSVLRPGGVDGFAGPVADFDQKRCRSLVSRALDGGSLGGQPVLIEASKKVMFRSVRCLMDAARDAGATDEDISFSTSRPD